LQEEAIIDDGIKTSRIVWDGQPVDITANEAIRATNERPAKMKEAKEFLSDYIKDGESVSSKEVYAEGKANGFSARTLQRAKDKLGIDAEKVLFEGGWNWKRRKNDS
jgi:hypothetical protein